MVTKELIECIKQTLRAGWIQGAYAKTDTGETVDIFDSKATHFCLAGAMRRCIGPIPIGEQGDTALYLQDDFVRAWRQTHLIPMILFNDGAGRTVEEICGELDVLSVGVSNDQPV